MKKELRYYTRDAKKQYLYMCNGTAMPCPSLCTPGGLVKHKLSTCQGHFAVKFQSAVELNISNIFQLFYKTSGDNKTVRL